VVWRSRLVADEPLGSVAPTGVWDIRAGARSNSATAPSSGKAKGPRTVEEYRQVLTRYAGRAIVFAGETDDISAGQLVATARELIGSRDPIWVDSMIARQARAAVVWQQTHGDHRATLRRLVDEAISGYVEQLKTQLNGGRDFPEPPEVFQLELLEA
jgi:hypothetical protein